ncbi:Arc family DNA-binding protein [Sphingopyxis sp. 2PD]|nr:Arc family DNA-binding protein [Sphingopyxis sp. 2PD]
MKTCDMKLRMPPKLKAMLKDRADANHRKMNGEIIAILERALLARQEAA